MQTKFTIGDRVRYGNGNNHTGLVSRVVYESTISNPDWYLCYTVFNGMHNITLNENEMSSFETRVKPTPEPTHGVLKDKG